ncbi:MAG: hypothetical protein Q7T11_03625, partial [Deltaproteobacteria bacterium]|nr:hypothetical protein [Deltaproteobacteria bacterium]
MTEIAALNLNPEDLLRWDLEQLHSHIEDELLKAGDGRDDLIKDLPDQLKVVREALEEERKEFRDIPRKERTENDKERIDQIGELLRELNDVLREARLVDQELDLLHIEAESGAATFAGYKKEGETYTINMNSSASPFGDDPTVELSPFSQDAGTPGLEEEIAAASVAPTAVDRDADKNGIADSDFDQNGVINFDDLSGPKTPDMLEKPHVFMQIGAGDLIDVIGYEKDGAATVLKCKVYDAEGNYAFVNIEGIDPNSFALLVNGGVTTQNLDSYRTNVPVEALSFMYWKDDIESFAEKFGMVEEIPYAAREAAIPKFNDFMESLDNLDFLPFSGNVPMDPLRGAVKKIFSLIDGNKMLTDQIVETWHEIIATDLAPLGDEGRAQVLTALVILGRMHFDEATFTSLYGPAGLEIEDSFTNVLENKHQMLAVIALESVIPLNYGGAEALLNKLFSAGMGTVGEFSGDEGIEALKLIQEFSARTGLFFPNIDKTLESEEELKKLGGIVEITDSLTKSLAVSAHVVADEFARGSGGKITLQAVDSGLLTLINNIKAMGPKVAVADIRTKIIDTVAVFPIESQDHVMAAFLTLVHEVQPKLFDRLTLDEAFIANSWAIIDNGELPPHNYQKIMEWLQTAVIEHEKEGTGVKIPEDEEGGILSSHTVKWMTGGAELGMT